MIEKVLDSHLSQNEEKAQRKLKAPATSEETKPEKENEDGESILKKAHREIKKDTGRKIIREVKVTDEHLK